MIEDGALALRASMDAGQISVQDLMTETLARVSRCMTASTPSFPYVIQIF